ncbi:cell wall hydrolase [Methylocystis sp. Sn-Cys]|uniref:cell wall hydrolase n=1 Tax=Methylocystis sp. Sn-Cys TaxID=1701263 RepID=UPI0019218791|nr:cell wall hydrolase [Methylocystis sp. Sn-Cys]MBL1258052.1 cell wall hydrolase [Methylocystis sp. Sn-Cys]
MRRRSKSRRFVGVLAPWAVSVMAPWALGVGALVSFTASAGQDTVGDWNVAPLTARARAAAAPATLQLASFGEIATGELGLSGQSRALAQSARLMVGAPDEMRSIPDEREPHVDLKPDAKDFPEVDRTHKGDPVIAMRPTFETRVINPAALGLAEPARLTFRIEGKHAARTSLALAPRGALPGDDAIYEAEAERAESLNTTQTQKATAAASPSQTASKATPPVAEPPRETANQAMADRALHGATPSVSRAVALSSSTPAQPDAVPIEVSSFPRATLALGAPDKAARPDYASLIDRDSMDRERRCLAEAVYFESRSEPEAGQAAVAQVVLNRTQSGLYPASICGVVYQNRHHYKACQFSFACEGKSLRITEPESWATAVRIANEVMDGRTYITDVGRSTHYHATYVKPRWARALTRMDMIGRHIFYRLKPGQT